MEINQYQIQALKFKNPKICRKNQLLDGLMGMNGEAGEAIDILKKHLFQGHDFDEHHLALELGDCLWYISLTANALGMSLDQIAAMNLEKLSNRYPENKFDIEQSLHRKEGDL